MLDIAAELERVSRLTRLLEPLAVLYEELVLDASVEPREISLRFQQRAVHLADNYGVAETVHFIDGETLQAAYEVWQEYRRIQRDLLDQRMKRIFRWLKIILPQLEELGADNRPSNADPDDLDLTDVDESSGIDPYDTGILQKK